VEKRRDRTSIDCSVHDTHKQRRNSRAKATALYTPLPVKRRSCGVPHPVLYVDKQTSHFEGFVFDLGSPKMVRQVPITHSNATPASTLCNQTSTTMELVSMPSSWAIPSRMFWRHRRIAKPVASSSRTCRRKCIRRLMDVEKLGDVQTRALPRASRVTRGGFSDDPLRRRRGHRCRVLLNRSSSSSGR
jgi:hypothetical protein